MLVHDRFVFLQVRKTGCMFVADALRRELPEDSWKFIAQHADWGNIPPDAADRPVLAYIRNPWDWYVSWYHFNLEFNEGRGEPFFRVMSEGGTLDFAATVRKSCTYFTECMGVDIYTFMFKTLVGGGLNSELLTVGRFENLVDDLERFLGRAGVTLEDDAIARIRAADPYNASRHSPYREYYDDALRTLVATSSTDLIERFGYEFGAEAGAPAEGAPPGFHVVRSRPRREWAPQGPPIVHSGGGGPDEIALTFDDGPSPWTAEIAAVFERHDCRATFFLRGAAVAERPQTVAALAAAGHELGNHLWSHSRSSDLSRAELRAEIGRTGRAIEAAGAPAPTLLRPPYIDGPRQLAEAAAGLGVRAVVTRSIGASDWAAIAVAQIVEPLLANARAGDIVCMHDGIAPGEGDSASRAPTAEAVATLVPALLERGLRPVTVSRLL